MQSLRFFAKAGVQCTGVRFPDTCSDTRLHNEEFVVAALMRPSLGRLHADRLILGVEYLKITVAVLKAHFPVLSLESNAPHVLLTHAGVERVLQSHRGKRSTSRSNPKFKSSGVMLDKVIRIPVILMLF